MQRPRTVPLAALALAGCGLHLPAGPPPGAPRPTVQAAVAGYLATTAAVGPALYRVSEVNFSRVDPRWARFEVTPVRAAAGRLQPLYGFARRGPAGWRVAGVGTWAVGCPSPGPPTATVPPPVLDGFGEGCRP